MKSKLLVILILLWTSCRVIAQQSHAGREAQWDFAIGAGAGRAVVADKKFSALSFTGVTISGNASVSYQRNKLSHQLDFSYASGTLQTGKKESSLQHNYFNADYINLYKLSDGNENKFVYKAGVCVNMLYAGRSFAGFINNKTSFDFATSIGAAASVQYFPGDPTTGFSITDRLLIPVVSAIVQPAFGSDNASGSLDKTGFSTGDIFSHGRIESFNSFVRIKNVLAIEKRLAGKNSIVLNYYWEYYHITGNREVLQANHMVLLSYFFIL